ncbi:NAD(P)/FAD-dependent oxidoreductase [Roseobacter sp. EG26]|uniref:NAD(P)/FAD-dependent oxidoreductase n=1 Tax=Roseobacter sp. EG26 TaxID=3412477 RepID=UPI003CE479B3
MQPFPISLETPVKFPGPLPDQADVVVIGGGIIGVSSALFLARAGKKTVLLEKGRVAAEQSSRNWGWIRQQGRDPDELPIMVEANRLWRELATQTNQDIGLRQAGVTYLAKSEAQMAKYAAWAPIAQELGVDTRTMGAAETAALVPGMSQTYAGALHTASDMRAEPWVAVPALAGIAAREGACIVENCAARALDIAAGRVAGVITEQGRISAPEVILAGGAWSALLLGSQEVFLPQLSVRATVAATSALPLITEGGVADDKIAFRRRADGGYTLAPGGFHELFIGWNALRSLPKFLTQLRAEPFGTRFYPAAPHGYPDAWTTPRRWLEGGISPFERMRVLNPPPNRSRANRLKGQFAALFPELPDFDLSHTWAGMIDTMPDLVPVVDRVAALPGLTLGTGMSGHGFGIGPAMGRILADLAQGKDPGHDLGRFRFSRFADGSAMRLGPAL